MITVEIPSEFKKLFDSDWREAAVYGGRYALKSHTVARILLIKARMAKIRIACFREFQNSIADSSHQLLSDLIKLYKFEDFEVKNNSIINTVTGSDFLFKGLWNNEQSIKSIEGIDIAWVEEAQTVSEKSLEVLTPTIRKDGSQIIYTYNRLLEEDPVHTRLVVQGRPNTLIINVNYDIAIKHKMIPGVILKEIEDDKIKRPALYLHKWLGEPHSMERKIYKDWQIIQAIPHEARLERRGLDFGYTNDPTSIVDIYYYNGGYILDERAFLKGLSNKQIADILLEGDNKALVVADSAEPKSIDEIRNYGVNIVPCKKGRDSVQQGIQLVQDQQISVTQRSSNIIREYRNYLWKIDREGKIINEPEHTYSHSMDSVRYGLTSLIDSSRIKKTDTNEYKKSTLEYLGKKGVINPLTRQLEEDKDMDQYVGQVKSYINM
jgi:phage terminase large subunit